jgi:HEAT repeat protein
MIEKTSESTPTREDRRIGELLGQLAAPLPAERDAALIALVDFIHRRMVRVAIAETSEKDPDPDVRYHARRICATIDDLFKSTPAPEVVAFVQRLRESGRLDVAEFHALMASTDPSVSLSTIVSVIGLQPPGLIDQLLPLLEKHQDPWVLASIIAAIGVAGTSQHFPAILPYFQHSSPRVLANTVSAAYALAPVEAFPLAAPLLSNPDNRVQGCVLMILAQKDPERCRSHIQLMANSRRESYRATALHLLKELGSPGAAAVAYEMFLSEDVNSLAGEEAALLGALAGVDAVPGLVQLAAHKPQRRSQVQSIIEQLAARYGWAPDTLRHQLARIDELCREPRKEAPRDQDVTLTGKIQMARANTGKDARANAHQRWLRPAAFVSGAGLLLLAVAFHGPHESLPPAASTADTGPSRAGGPSFAVPAVKSGRQWITGTVAYRGPNSVLVKSGYTYYLFEFAQPAEIVSVTTGQSLTIQGENSGWDAEAGVVRMSAPYLDAPHRDRKPDRS